MVEVRKISDEEARKLKNLKESHFLDVKSKRIKPAKLTQTVSAFANSAGGEIFIGIDEERSDGATNRTWNGFVTYEDANGIFQALRPLDPLGNNIRYEFIESENQSGSILKILVNKLPDIATASDGKVYVRKNAQKSPLSDEEIERLRYSKGVVSYEDQLMSVDTNLVSNSNAIIEFLIDVVPTGEPDEWLRKQLVILEEKPTVAGILLYSDNPQSILPKRSAIKILRYQTKEGAERDFLSSDPETIEGPLYDLIYKAVARVREIIEGIQKLGPSGMERVKYPEEALHELLTNAVIHRDYSTAADVQVRIFDNRVEIESPGKLPGHVTVGNIADTQYARNPKIVRLINKFKNPPNKDVGEGINTAFEAMEKLRLKKPEFVESDGSLIVILKHESLASPEQIVLQYLEENEEITNQIGRELTGIKSENTMKNVFYRLRDKGEVEQAPKVAGKKHSWRKIRDFNG